MTFLIRNIIYKYSTIVLLVVLCICSIFVSDNNLRLQNDCISNEIQELTDRRTGESPVNTSKCKFCRLLSTHLSGNSSKIKTIEMDNNLQAGPNFWVSNKTQQSGIHKLLKILELRRLKSQKSEKFHKVEFFEISLVSNINLSLN